MGKKNFFTVLTVMMVTCFFGACGRSDTEESMSQTQIQPDGSGQGEQLVSEEESGQMSLEQDLTGQTITDRGVESYEHIQRFSYELFAQNIQDKNPVLSPVSAYLALSMAGCGADGRTKEEFEQALGQDMMALSGDMMDTLPAEGDVLRLSIADSAWIDDELVVDGHWLDTVQSLMGAETFQADLSTAEAMEQINRWIDDRTNGLIDKMLAEPLDVETRLALFNTVYFKGKWEIPFEANDTYKEDFYLDKEKDEKEQVDMMNLYMTDLDYIANDVAEGVILPYQKNEDGSGSQNLAFIALKPIGEAEIRDVYDKLTNEVIKAILGGKNTELVNLKLPKFEMTFDKKLNESLSNMGLTECFDMDKANFDRIGKTQSGDNLYISLVQQKAKVIVDEEGTEAAAVTEILMASGAAMVEPQEPREVYFNEPFLYMIMDMDREIPLFIGILDEPVS